MVRRTWSIPPPHDGRPRNSPWRALPGCRYRVVARPSLRSRISPIAARPSPTRRFVRLWRRRRDHGGGAIGSNLTKLSNRLERIRLARTDEVLDERPWWNCRIVDLDEDRRRRRVRSGSQFELRRLLTPYCPAQLVVPAHL